MKLGKEIERKKAEVFNCEYLKKEKWYGDFEGSTKLNWQGLSLIWEQFEFEKFPCGSGEYYG
jgi:hypothetical protein